MTKLPSVCQSAVDLHKLQSAIKTLVFSYPAAVVMPNDKRKKKDTEVVADKKESPKDHPYAFVKELTAKQNKRIYIVEEFNATKRDAPVEGKFYSGFNEASSKVFAERQQHWTTVLESRKDSLRKQEFPVLESQTYGWMPSGLNRKAVMRINCIQAPKQRCEMTAYDENLISERVTQRPKFLGTRFIVN